MAIGSQLTIQTPVGPVEIGDTIKIDMGDGVVARNYNWPKIITGKVFSCHADYLLVNMDVPIPTHLKTPMPPTGFAWHLGEDTAYRVVEVIKP